MNANKGALESVAHEERRQLLLEVLEDGPHYVPELTRASREMTAADDGLLEQYMTGSLEVAGVDKALVRLYAVHLPLLTEHRFVEWDRRTREVTRGPRFDEVEPLLERVDDGGVPGSLLNRVAPTSE